MTSPVPANQVQYSPAIQHTKTPGIEGSANQEHKPVSPMGDGAPAKERHCLLQSASMDAMGSMTTAMEKLMKERNACPVPPGRYSVDTLSIAASGRSPVAVSVSRDGETTQTSPSQ